jgi:hypothetical protein
MKEGLFYKNEEAIAKPTIHYFATLKNVAIIEF